MAMADYPRVKSLKLRNFKGIAELDLDFDESLTLLAGINGAGKTSILQALLAAVTHTWGHLQPVYNYPRFRLPERLPRAGATGTEIVLGVVLAGCSLVEVQYIPDQRNQRLIKVDRSQLTRPSEEVPSPLPLVVYYEQSRVFASNGTRGNMAVSTEENRKSSLYTTVSSPAEFKSWFFEKEADEGQEARDRNDPKYEDRELGEVRKLLRSLDEFSAVRSRKYADSRFPAGSRRSSCWRRTWRGA